MRANKLSSILVWSVFPLWLSLPVIAFTSDDIAQDTPASRDAIVAFEPAGAASILAKAAGNVTDRPVFVLELNLARAEFDDETYVGDITLWGYTLAIDPFPRFQIGYSYLTNNHIYGDWEPSLDEGPEIAGGEDFDISSALMYIRKDWSVDDRLSLFALIGYSKLEIETSLTKACFFVCGELIKVTGKEITYKHEQTGVGWGLGIQRKIGNSSAWTLRYIDQSVSDFDFRSIRLDLVFRG